MSCPGLPQRHGPRLLPGKDGLAEAIWIAFVVVQALDGAMTFIGIHRFGTHIEANPLLAWYAQALGPAAGAGGGKTVCRRMRRRTISDGSA